MATVSQMHKLCKIDFLIKREKVNVKTFKRYILLIFLVENLLAQQVIFASPAWLFNAIVITGGILMLDKNIWTRPTIAKCWPLYALALVYILYQFTIGLETLSMHTLRYLGGRLASFIIIVTAVTADYKFYYEKVPTIIPYIAIFIVIIGLMRTGVVVGDRNRLGFGNVNSTGTISAICLGAVLFFFNKYPKAIALSMMAIFLYAILTSGSRSSILIFAIMLVFWTGLSFRKSLVLLVLLVSSLYMISMMPEEFSGISRVKSTISGKETSGREAEREACRIMISERPVDGWGFESENVGRAALVSDLGSHSFYLESIKWLGYPFAILFFIVLYLSVLPLLRFARSGDIFIRYDLAVIISLIVAAFFEEWFLGVHEFQSNMAYCSLAIVTTYRYNMNKK